MIVMNRFAAAVLGAALLVFGHAALAQPKPSAEAIDMAKQIVTLKGGDTLFASLIPGVIEQGKAMFEQQNPALGKDLSTVAAKLRTDLAPRVNELNDQIARTYATHFTEGELKELLAFYKSPVGRKMTAEEPKAIQEGMMFAQEWSNKFSDEVLRKFREEMKKKGHDL